MNFHCLHSKCLTSESVFKSHSCTFKCKSHVLSWYPQDDIDMVKNYIFLINSQEFIIILPVHLENFGIPVKNWSPTPTMTVIGFTFNLNWLHFIKYQKEFLNLMLKVFISDLYDFIVLYYSFTSSFNVWRKVDVFVCKTQKI